MSLICVSKPWDELTKEELYRIIQLRIEGFIVRDETCYQDLEQYYDQCGWYLMFYDPVIGVDPELMVGQHQLCTRKVFTGDDGKEYKYPAWRRQAWLKGYIDLEYCDEMSRRVAIKMTGEPYTMHEMLNKEVADKLVQRVGFRYIKHYVDDHGRDNWVMVNDLRQDADKFKE